MEQLALYIEESRGITNWREITKADLHDYAIYLSTRHQTKKGAPVSTGTLRQRLSCVRGFFGWMSASGRLINNPAAALELPRKENTLPRVLSEKDIARLIEMADVTTAVGLRDRALMETLYATGIRHAEAYKLNLYDVDLVGCTLIVREGKGKRDRVVPLTEPAARWIRRYIAQARVELSAGRNNSTQALWLAVGGRRLSYQMMAERIRDYANQAGLNATVHTFRHSCATHLLKHGASVRHIQQLLGHTGLETTEIYTHIEIEDLKRVVERAYERNTVALKDIKEKEGRQR